jgi:predicted O-methyltransferase YrrM
MQHFYKSIPGFFNYECVYDKVIDKLETGANIVEVGVWKGMSVAYAAVKVLQLKKDIKIYAVDTFEGSSGEVGPLDKNSINSDSVYEECRTNLEPVSSIVSIIRSDSIEASKMFDDQSLDFVFIDAAHSYQYVKADIEAWLPKVKSGGFIGGHDYLNSDPTHADGGVTRAVQEIFKDYNIEQMGSEIFSWLVELKKD